MLYLAFILNVKSCSLLLLVSILFLNFWNFLKSCFLVQGHCYSIDSADDTDCTKKPSKPHSDKWCLQQVISMMYDFWKQKDLYEQKEINLF